MYRETTNGSNGANGRAHELGYPAFDLPPPVASLSLVGGGADRFRHAALEIDAADRGANVELRWNFESAPTGPVRAVVFLHGFANNSQASRMRGGQLSLEGFLREKADDCGLRFTENVGTAHGKPPVLAIIPRGVRETDGFRRFTFPNVNATSIRPLIKASLRQVASRHFGGQALRFEQIYLMAHSGGGAGINALLAAHFDPDGICCFDSTYDGPGPISAWLRARAHASRPRSLRIFVSQDSRCHWVTRDGRTVRSNGTETYARQILPALGTPASDRRIEYTSGHHGDVDTTYSLPLALDIAANVDGLGGFHVRPLAELTNACASPPPAPAANAHEIGNHAFRESGYGELPISYSATAPHPVHPVTGDAPSKLFDEGDDPATDMLVDKMGQIGGSDELLRRGLIVAPAGAAATTTFRMRLRGRLVVPRDLASRPSSVPIVFIVMGNHNAFDGGREIENFTGYDYLQQTLADLGIASCSVDTNLANALNLGIRTRAEMMLETMRLVQSSAPATVRSKLDFSKVGLVGHSRGGEAVVMGAMLASARGLSFGIRAVGSIAPTDFTLGRSGGPIDGSIAVPMRLGGPRLLVLYGSHDGDVGDVLFNGFGIYDRARCDKTIVYARGLTHNRFNTVWNECADYGDGRHAFVDDVTCRTRAGTFDQRIFAAVVHREYAKFFMTALMRRTLLGDASAEDTLRGLVAPTRAQLQQQAGLAGPAASVQWSLTSALNVDEFDSTGIGARTPTGGAVEPAAATRPTVPHLTRAFVARAAGHKVRVDVPAASKDLRARRELCFRLTSMIPVTSEDVIARAPAPDWEVRIVSGRGTSSARVAQLDTRGLRAPNRPFFNELGPTMGGNVTKNQYDTLTLPLSSFTNVDLSDVRAVEFEARGGSFPLIVDSISFV